MILTWCSIVLHLCHFIIFFLELLNGIKLLLFVQGDISLNSCGDIGSSWTSPWLKSWCIIVSIWRDSFLQYLIESLFHFRLVCIVTHLLLLLLSHLIFLFLRLTCSKVFTDAWDCADISEQFPRWIADYSFLIRILSIVFEILGT